MKVIFIILGLVGLFFLQIHATNDLSKECRDHGGKSVTINGIQFIGCIEK